MVERDGVPGEVRDWRGRAACRDMDGEQFFPTAEAGPELERAEAAAKRVCAGCPVRAECLAWALEVLPFGVAGGLGEAERAQRRRGDRPVRVPRKAAPVALAGPSWRGGRAPSQALAQGYAALARGTDRELVAQECGVSRRTVDRWAAALRDGSPVGVGGAR